MNQQVALRIVETPDEMEAVKALRVQVFVNEQGVPLEEEFDEHDDTAIHVLALVGGRVVGTGRMFSDSLGETYIGRMAVDVEHRRYGIGREMLVFLEEQARERNITKVKLHAQTYVKSFYERQGYVAQGESFMEVAIEHVLMTKKLKSM